jgi:hypothetical protein
MSEQWNRSPTVLEDRKVPRRGKINLRESEGFPLSEKSHRPVALSIFPKCFAVARNYSIRDPGTHRVHETMDFVDELLCSPIRKHMIWARTASPGSSYGVEDPGSAGYCAKSRRVDQL